MSPSVFFVEPELLREVSVSTAVTLPQQVAHHVHVMRITPGEVCELVDGHGKRITGAINAEGAFIVARVAKDPAPKLRIDVAQALIKGDRLETAIDMMTQVGVSGFIPWIADHCVVKWVGDKTQKQLIKWNNVVAAASEQSRRSWLPTVQSPMTSGELAQKMQSYDHVVVLEESHGANTTDIESGSVLLLVGPEGGCSARERELFEQGISLTLGTSVFRSETAGVVGVSYLMTKSGEWDSQSGGTVQGFTNA